MGDGIRIFERGELSVFGADYDARLTEPDGNPAASFLAETPAETNWTTRLSEFYERDAQLAYGYRARFAQDEGATAPALGRGDRGRGVRDLQETLVRLGHLSAAAMATGPGIFGRQTENALKEFQRAGGLNATGVYDGATRTAVEAITGGVRRGARGELVARLQRRLVELNYLTPQQTATGPGIYGRQTESAVKRFQAEHGIRQTGALGPLTYRALRTAAPSGEGDGDLRLSENIREGTSRTRQAVSSPVLGDFTVTASFMDPDGHGYKTGGAYAIYSGDPQRVVRIGPSRVNLGIDYVTPDGRIRNWFGGSVERLSYEAGGYGHRAVIRTDLTYRYRGRDYTVFAHYAHAAGPFGVRRGDRVTPGQDIGRMGNTGASQGAHVDFRTWIDLGDGRRVDISPNLLVRRRRNPTTNPTPNTTGGVEAPTTPVRPRGENRPAGELTLGVNERYRGALLLAERRTGIDAAALAGLINAEASREGNGHWIADSYNRRSGAAGLTQFLASTWVGRATTAGTYLNEVAVERGLVRRDQNGRFMVVDRQALLDLRDDPTASIVSAAEYGRDNLRSLERLGLLPANMTDDQRARYMYYAHHEGLAGAVRLLTDSRTATEDGARSALALRLGARPAAALAREHGSYRAAFRVWTEGQARRLFPTQVEGGAAGQRVIARYVAEHGDYEHGYRAWLEEYTARQVRPENYRR
ncbi:MAG TPA: peptidoglycan-binding protein [Pyrinomonadaceae bacterium]|jgi:peptidoglycan hydrolase-like protein with peptidoglycan-binding domain